MLEHKMLLVLLSLRKLQRFQELCTRNSVQIIHTYIFQKPRLTDFIYNLFDDGHKVQHLSLNP